MTALVILMRKPYNIMTALVILICKSHKITKALVTAAACAGIRHCGAVVVAWKPALDKGDVCPGHCYAQRVKFGGSV